MVEALIRLVGCTSLFDNCLLSMRISGFCGKGKTRSMGLRQGCPLSATLFGLFIDGLHHCLEAMAPAAGVQVKHMRLRELVYADDICMIASSPEQLHALIDAFKLVFLLCYHAHGDRRPKDKSDGCLSGACTSYGVLMQYCNGNAVKQVATFKYLGLHFHQSGAVVHLIDPIKSGGSWAAVQRRHSLLQCGKSVNLQLHLKKAVLVPVIQFGCQMWGMHSPRVAAADHARLALQCL